MSNVKESFEFFHECEMYIRELTVSSEGIHLIESKWKTGFLGCIKSIEEQFKTFVEPEDSPLSFLMTYKLSQNHRNIFQFDSKPEDF